MRMPPYTAHTLPAQHARPFWHRKCRVHFARVARGRSLSRSMHMADRIDSPTGPDNTEDLGVAGDIKPSGDEGLSGSGTDKNRGGQTGTPKPQPDIKPDPNKQGGSSNPTNK